jgi:hypothetical protein
MNRKEEIINDLLQGRQMILDAVGQLSVQEYDEIFF